jgi:ribosomal protein L29
MRLGKTVMPSNTTTACAAKDDYVRQLRELTDEELRQEWTDYRRRYSPLRTELLIRRIAARDLRNSTPRHLIGVQKMREAISKLKLTRETNNDPRNAANQ